MASKPAPSINEPPRHWEQAFVTLIYQWKNIREGEVEVNAQSKG